MQRSHAFWRSEPASEQLIRLRELLGIAEAPQRGVEPVTPARSPPPTSDAWDRLSDPLGVGARPREPAATRRHSLHTAPNRWGGVGGAENSAAPFTNDGDDDDGDGDDGLRQPTSALREPAQGWQARPQSSPSLCSAHS